MGILWLHRKQAVYSSQHEQVPYLADTSLLAILGPASAVVEHTDSTSAVVVLQRPARRRAEPSPASVRTLRVVSENGAPRDADQGEVSKGDPDALSVQVAIGMHQFF